MSCFNIGFIKKGFSFMNSNSINSNTPSSLSTLQAPFRAGESRPGQCLVYDFIQTVDELVNDLKLLEENEEMIDELRGAQHEARDLQSLVGESCRRSTSQRYPYFQ